MPANYFREGGLQVRIGFAGVPAEAVMAQYRNQGQLLDLDNDFGFDVGLAEKYIPKVYCAIIKRILTNALKLKIDLAIIDVGKGKCDAGWFVAEVIKREMGIPVISTMNHNSVSMGHPICESALPLLEKFELLLQRPLGVEMAQPPRVEPVAGFWGVPPYDFEILKLFPDRTHVFGWARCFENGTPADLELEMFVPQGLPTVFFAQSFCQKNLLAQYLAEKHGGLYIDVDKALSNSARAKIEAFLTFHGVGGENR